jgi:hypothetical protein
MRPAPPVRTPPLLPEKSGSVSIPVREWPFKPGPREMALHIRYPGSGLQNVREDTGLRESVAPAQKLLLHFQHGIRNLFDDRHRK